MAKLTPGKLVVIAVIAGGASLLLVWWAVQTAWLGSFPGRDVEYFSRVALIQLSTGVILAGVAFWAVYLALRKNRRSGEP